MKKHFWDIFFLKIIYCLDKSKKQLHASLQTGHYYNSEKIKGSTFSMKKQWLLK